MWSLSGSEHGEVILEPQRGFEKTVEVMQRVPAVSCFLRPKNPPFPKLLFQREIWWKCLSRDLVYLECITGISSIICHLYGKCTSGAVLNFYFLAFQIERISLAFTSFFHFFSFNILGLSVYGFVIFFYCYMTIRV